MTNMKITPSTVLRPLQSYALERNSSEKQRADISKLPSISELNAVMDNYNKFLKTYGQTWDAAANRKYTTVIKIYGKDKIGITENGSLLDQDEILGERFMMSIMNEINSGTSHAAIGEKIARILNDRGWNADSIHYPYGRRPRHIDIFPISERPV